ncbi:hypothetical protein [Fodinibius sp. SL11]|uniref:hypothetical protein n=1 Tax=Fodinibius sp. SL11 TaxID=3425690 RepID=UPI003F883BC7
MSEITGKEFSEGFKMRVVSGMLVDGSIQVTWATGKKASSQMDWGLDPENLATTPEYHREPSEMVRYHTLYFPVTYLDARHFFRVRSKTINGLVGQSPIYSVITPDDVQKVNETPFGIVHLDITPIDTTEFEFRPAALTTPAAKHEPISRTGPISATLQTDLAISEEQRPETGNANTNIITTIS